MDKKDPKSIPANYYEPDYNGPGCGIALVLLFGALIMMALGLWIVFEFIIIF